MLGAGLGLGLTKTVRTTAGALVGQASVLNDYGTPTFTRASTAYDPYNRTTAISGARRRRAMAISRYQTLYADLIETGRTNLVLRSQDLSNASWTKTDSTITTGAANAPDGTATLDLVTEGSAGTATVSQVVTITAGRTFIACGHFKRGNADWVLMRGVSGSDSITAWFNLSTGVAGTVTAAGTATAAVSDIIEEPVGSGIYRCWFGGVINAAGTAITFSNFNTSADAVTTRVNGATRYCGWFDAGITPSAATTLAFPGTYIPTTSATVTRASDALSAAYVLGQTGTVLALAIPYCWTGDQGNNGWGVFAGDDSTQTFMSRNSVTQLSGRRPDGAGSESSLFNHQATKGVLHHYALTWDSAAVSTYRDGALVGSPDTTLTPPYLTNTLINIGIGATSRLGGWVALLAWPRALTASELLAIYSAFPVAV